VIECVGFNNEVIQFNKWQKYEFWDLGGSPAQRPFWKKVYGVVQFNYIVYVLNGEK